MKNYMKPSVEIVTSLSAEFCALVDAVSDNEVIDRVIISVEDELD